MIQCVTCGSVAADDSGKCSRCGAEPASANGGATAVLTSVEVPRPRAVSGLSRLSASAEPDEGRFLSGTLVAGRYRVIGLLGRGGMGEVYRATDLTLAQSVALKFLPDHAAGNERLLERFHNEVRIARQVTHPNVCRVYDIGEAEGLPFISMEYVDGEDLASLLARIGRLPSGKALEITRKLCAGLAAAHERGIIHRDLKPHNIMLNKRGEVIIMDFGLAAVADQLDGAEARNGTPAYMAPEQLRGAAVTLRSDLYALGLIVYELFTGKRAFDANSMAELLRAEESTRPLSITSIASDVDPAVDRIILRCLQPDPAQRPPNALAIAAALPGGDPLAAALAAGETPSPELVAASGKTEGFAPRYAVPCLVFALLGTLAFPFVSQPLSLFAVTPVDYSPAVLQQKAKEIAGFAGYSPKPVDWISQMSLDNDLLTYLKDHRQGKPWEQLLTAEPPIRFIYRQSPQYLLSPPDGRVTVDRPPLNLPGMVSISLDSRARLRTLKAVAPRFDENVSQGAPLDMAAVFRQAGFDLNQFHEVTPSYAPALAFDQRHAWAGVVPGIPNLPITVEIATWRGVLTSFFIRWPWTKAPSEPPQSASDLSFTFFSILLTMVGLAFALYFARHNLRAGRGDRKGAYRFATAAYLLYCLAWIMRLHVTPRFNMLDYAFQELGSGFALCALMWLLYIALEPAVRARWPHSLITWNRLLAGQFGDPRLGSHILIGVVMGLAMSYLFHWRWHWLMAAGGPPNDTELDVIAGLRPLVGNLANTMFTAIMGGSITFFLLCGARALLRWDWLAAFAAAVLLTLQEGGIRHSANMALDVPLYVLVFAAFCFALLRMGLVPTILGLFIVNTASKIPVSGDFSAWYNPAAVLLALLIAGIAVYGFLRSQTTIIIRDAEADRFV